MQTPTNNDYLLEDELLEDYLDDVATLHYLWEGRVYTIADVVTLSDKELLAIRGIGKIRLEELRDQVEEIRGWIKPLWPVRELQRVRAEREGHGD